MEFLSKLKFWGKEEEERRQAVISFKKTSKGYVMTVKSFTDIDDVTVSEFSVKELAKDDTEFGYWVN